MGFFDDSYENPPPGDPGTNGPPPDGTPGPQQPPGQSGGGGNIGNWWDASDPRGSVMRLLGGMPPTSNTLQKLAPLFEQVGIKLSPANAEGIISKIYVPGVGWTRVGDGGTAGPNGGQFTGWTWIPQGEGGGGLGDLGGQAGPGPFNPTGTPFVPQTYNWEKFTPPDPFVAPILSESNDPGYQFRLDQGARAYEKSAFGRGIGLTGGTAKGLVDYNQQAGSAEYGNVYNRAFNAYNQNFSQLMGVNQQNNGGSLSALGMNNQYGLAADQNQYYQQLQRHQTQYGDLYNLANLGYQATNSSYL